MQAINIQITAISFVEKWSQPGAPILPVALLVGVQPVGPRGAEGAAVVRVALELVLTSVGWLVKRDVVVKALGPAK